MSYTRKSNTNTRASGINLGKQSLNNYVVPAGAVYNAGANQAATLDHEKKPVYKSAAGASYPKTPEHVVSVWAGKPATVLEAEGKMRSYSKLARALFVRIERVCRGELEKLFIVKLHSMFGREVALPHPDNFPCPQDHAHIDAIYAGKQLTHYFQGVLAKIMLDFAQFSDALLKYCHEEEHGFPVASGRRKHSKFAKSEYNNDYRLQQSETGTDEVDDDNVTHEFSKTHRRNLSTENNENGSFVAGENMPMAKHASANIKVSTTQDLVDPRDTSSATSGQEDGSNAMGKRKSVGFSGSEGNNNVENNQKLLNSNSSKLLINNSCSATDLDASNDLDGNNSSSKLSKKKLKNLKNGKNASGTEASVISGVDGQPAAMVKSRTAQSLVRLKGVYGDANRSDSESEPGSKDSDNSDSENDSKESLDDMYSTDEELLDYDPSKKTSEYIDERFYKKYPSKAAYLVKRLEDQNNWYEENSRKLAVVNEKFTHARRGWMKEQMMWQDKMLKIRQLIPDNLLWEFEALNKEVVFYDDTLYSDESKIHQMYKTQIHELEEKLIEEQMKFKRHKLDSEFEIAKLKEDIEDLHNMIRLKGMGKKTAEGETQVEQEDLVGFFKEFECQVPHDRFLDPCECHVVCEICGFGSGGNATTGNATETEDEGDERMRALQRKFHKAMTSGFNLKDLNEGDVVMRGKDWDRGDEDGFSGNTGVIKSIDQRTKTVTVEWHEDVINRMAPISISDIKDPAMMKDILSLTRGRGWQRAHANLKDIAALGKRMTSSESDSEMKRTTSKEAALKLSEMLDKAEEELGPSKMRELGLFRRESAVSGTESGIHTQTGDPLSSASGGASGSMRGEWAFKPYSMKYTPVTQQTFDSIPQNVKKMASSWDKLKTLFNSDEVNHKEMWENGLVQKGKKWFMFQKADKQIKRAESRHISDYKIDENAGVFDLCLLSMEKGVQFPERQSLGRFDAECVNIPSDEKLLERMRSGMSGGKLDAEDFECVEERIAELAKTIDILDGKKAARDKMLGVRKTDLEAKLATLARKQQESDAAVASLIAVKPMKPEPAEISGNVLEEVMAGSNRQTPNGGAGGGMGQMSSSDNNNGQSGRQLVGGPGSPKGSSPSDSPFRDRQMKRERSRQFSDSRYSSAGDSRSRSPSRSPVRSPGDALGLVSRWAVDFSGKRGVLESLLMQGFDAEELLTKNQLRQVFNKAEYLVTERDFDVLWGLGSSVAPSGPTRMGRVRICDIFDGLHRCLFGQKGSAAGSGGGGPHSAHLHGNRKLPTQMLMQRPPGQMNPDYGQAGSGQHQGQRFYGTGGQYGHSGHHQGAMQHPGQSLAASTRAPSAGTNDENAISSAGQSRSASRTRKQPPTTAGNMGGMRSRYGSGNTNQNNQNSSNKSGSLLARPKSSGGIVASQENANAGMRYKHDFPDYGRMKSQAEAGYGGITKKNNKVNPAEKWGQQNSGENANNRPATASGNIGLTATGTSQQQQGSFASGPQHRPSRPNFGGGFNAKTGGGTVNPEAVDSLYHGTESLIRQKLKAAISESNLVHESGAEEQQFRGGTSGHVNINEVLRPLDRQEFAREKKMPRGDLRTGSGNKQARNNYADMNNRSPPRDGTNSGQHQQPPSLMMDGMIKGTHINFNESQKSLGTTKDIGSPPPPVYFNLTNVVSGNASGPGTQSESAQQQQLMHHQRLEMQQQGVAINTMQDPRVGSAKPFVTGKKGPMSRALPAFTNEVLIASPVKDVASKKKGRSRTPSPDGKVNNPRFAEESRAVNIGAASNISIDAGDLNDETPREIRERNKRDPPQHKSLKERARTDKDYASHFPDLHGLDRQGAANNNKARGVERVEVLRKSKKNNYGGDRDYSRSSGGSSVDSSPGSSKKGLSPRRGGGFVVHYDMANRAPPGQYTPNRQTGVEAKYSMERVRLSEDGHTATIKGVTPQQLSILGFEQQVNRHKYGNVNTNMENFQAHSSNNRMPVSTQLHSDKGLLNNMYGGQRMDKSVSAGQLHGQNRDSRPGSSSSTAARNSNHQRPNSSTGNSQFNNAKSKSDQKNVASSPILRPEEVKTRELPSDFSPKGSIVHQKQEKPHMHFSRKRSADYTAAAWTEDSVLHNPADSHITNMAHNNSNIMNNNRRNNSSTSPRSSNRQFQFHAVNSKEEETHQAKLERLSGSSGNQPKKHWNQPFDPPDGIGSRSPGDMDSGRLDMVHVGEFSQMGIRGEYADLQANREGDSPSRKKRVGGGSNSPGRSGQNNISTNAMQVAMDSGNVEVSAGSVGGVLGVSGGISTLRGNVMGQRAGGTSGGKDARSGGGKGDYNTLF